MTIVNYSKNLLSYDKPNIILDLDTFGFYLLIFIILFTAKIYLPVVNHSFLVNFFFLNLSVFLIFILFNLYVVNINISI